MGAIRSESSQTTRTRIETQSQNYVAYREAEARIEVAQHDASAKIGVAQHDANARIGVAQHQSDANKIEAVEATKRANIWASTLPQLAMIVMVGLVLIVLIWRRSEGQQIPLRVQQAMIHFGATQAILQDGQWLLLDGDQVVARQRLLAG